MKQAITVIILFCLTAFAPPSPQLEQVTLRWDYDLTANTNVTQFEIGYQIGSPVTNWNGTNIIWGQYTNFMTVGKVTNAIVTGLQRGKLYYFSALAVTSDNIKSEWSNEVFTNTLPKPGNPKLNL